MDLAAVGEAIAGAAGRLFRLHGTGLGSVLSPMVLGSTLAICLALWLYRRPGEPFLAWLLPARVWWQRGTWIDVALFLGNGLAGGMIALNSAAVATATALLMWTWFGIMPAAPSAWGALWGALVLFLASDFTGYAYHRLYHRVAFLWPFHAVHHAAEEMNPITAFRHHPLFSLSELVIYGVMLGVVQALAVVLLTGTMDLATLAGTNVFFAVFRLAGANLRHSHIWLRYPAWLEHILISPAQHQIHHSVDPRHHDRNYGEVLAVWDWIGGSLHVTRPEEAGLVFGLGDAAGNRLPQPYPRLRDALLRPVAESWRVLRPHTGRGRPAMTGIAPRPPLRDDLSGKPNLEDLK
jgi:sterol desaturase/sphingolipid hydroxylase (fatty acid hydroxylase superfamily)